MEKIFKKIHGLVKQKSPIPFVISFIFITQPSSPPPFSVIKATVQFSQ